MARNGLRFRMVNIITFNDPVAFEHAFNKAVSRGLMTQNQYWFIARELYTSRPCHLLVIGAGYDSELWYRCVEGHVIFIEEIPELVSQVPNCMQYTFASKVGQWCPVPELPQAINKPWDYVLVDGPGGYDQNTSGRQIPVAWASKLARKAIFVHDYERPWEKEICDKYLGEATEMIEAENRDDRCLAVFRR